MKKINWGIFDRFVNRGQVPGQKPVKIIFGLGNPGPKYSSTRHNVGFWCIDLLAEKYSISLERRNALALIGWGNMEGVSVVIAKPRTFVNLSGDAVKYLVNRYHLSANDVIVIHDDMDLPLGRLRVRAKGSAGGHNGIKSIVTALQTECFPRIRVGIGRPLNSGEEISHVLGLMSSAERQAIDETIEKVAEVVISLLTEDIEKTMNRFN